MNCNEVEHLLADYLGDELNTPQRTALDAHVRSCPACGNEVATLRESLAMVRSLDVGVTVLSPTKPERRQTTVIRLWRRGLARGLAYAATLLVGFGVGWSARPVSPTSGPPATTSDVEVLASRFGVHPEWVDAVVATSRPSASSAFGRNLVRFARSAGSAY